MLAFLPLATGVKEMIFQNLIDQPEKQSRPVQCLDLCHLALEYSSFCIAWRRYQS
jgi:hypothetical protein